MRRGENDRGFSLLCQLSFPGFPVFGEAALEDPIPAEDPGEPEGHGPLDLDLQDAPVFLQKGDPLQRGGEIQVLRPVSEPPVDGQPQVPAGLEVGRAVVYDETGGPQTGIMVPEVGELPADLSVPRDLLSREEALRSGDGGLDPALVDDAVVFPLQLQIHGRILRCQAVGAQAELFLEYGLFQAGPDEPGVRGIIIEGRDGGEAEGVGLHISLQPLQEPVRLAPVQQVFQFEALHHADRHVLRLLFVCWPECTAERLRKD